MHRPTTIDELRDAMIELRRVRVVAGGTKPALSHDATLSTAKLRGVVGYDPGEFTFTAHAGTPLSEIRDMLAENRQFLAFDPPLVEAGSTLGGAVAAGMSGPGRLRFGGVRDFLLGARLVTGEGRIVFGGGKVVKNAAGFDIPKLMVGARGQYGVLAELTFKVFPQVEAYATLQVECPSLETALRVQADVASSPLEPACLDLLPPGRLLIRVGGLSEALGARLERLRQLCGAGDVLRDEADAALWREARELAWAPRDRWLLRVAITPADIPKLDPLLETLGAERRYSVAGNVAWVSCDREVQRDQLQEICLSISRVGVALRGAATEPVLGRQSGEGFRRRLRSVFDPQGRLEA